MVTRLTELIFVQAVRVWLKEQPESQGGWLGALRDRQIGAALGLMHREPNRNWSVAALADEVAMSRSKSGLPRELTAAPVDYFSRRLSIGAVRIAD